MRNSSSGGDSTRTIERFSAVSSSTLFTPKRKLNDPQLPYTATKNTDILEPITTTQFVEWCGKIFNKRIYRTLYDEEQSGARDWMVDGVTRYTSLIPSDWALHTAEGVEQHSERDMTKIQKSELNTFTSLHTLNFNRTIHCLEWSYLRPFVYVCDGRKVEVYNTMSKNRNAKPDFEIVVNDDPLFEDPLTDIIAVNEKNHEILLMGTQDGLISVWDPYFDEHSHKTVGVAKMLTSNHIFNDQTRIYNNHQTSINNKRFSKYTPIKTNHTLYRWDQNNGRLLCGGNVRISRIWDAWAEKNKTDINLEMKDGITSSLCADFNQELVCIGFNSGVSSIYDVRITGKFSKIMGLRSETRSKVVGCSFLGESSRLIIGHEDSIIKVYDPRKFEEPLEVFKADEFRVEQPKPLTSSFMSFGSSNNNIVKVPNYPLAMNNMIVQSSNSIIACAMNDSTIRLFDLYNKRHKSLEYVLHPQASSQPSISPSIISTMRFHSRRVHLATATDKNVVGVYTVN